VGEMRGVRRSQAIRDGGDGVEGSERKARCLNHRVSAGGRQAIGDCCDDEARS
jgi:hypothetical protein